MSSFLGMDFKLIESKWESASAAHPHSPLIMDIQINDNEDSDNEDNDNEDNNNKENDKTKTKKRIQYWDVRAVSHSCDVFFYIPYISKSFEILHGNLRSCDPLFLFIRWQLLEEVLLSQ